MSLDWRSVSPQTTIERISHMLPAMGITRVANVTGLDVVGIPVFNVCRPNARSNSVFQGKGIDIEQARASGIMEAVETYCAEHVLQPIVYASAGELRKGSRTVLTKLPRPNISLYSENNRLLWIEGQDLRTASAVWLPFESVHADFSLPAPPGTGCFFSSTNGLASGNDRQEAILHGLCEVIERDSAALFSVERHGIGARRLDLVTVDDGDSLMALNSFHAAGLAVAIWDITSDIGISAFRCHVMERSDGPGLLSLPAEGFGCHPDRGVALARALTEAAQSRVTLIAGSRDDMGPQLYNSAIEPGVLAAWRHIVETTTGVQRFQEVPTSDLAVRSDADDASRAIDNEINHIMENLERVGIEQVVVTDLTPKDMQGFCVVRVVVPGLEVPAESACVPGLRLLAHADRFQ